MSINETVLEMHFHHPLLDLFRNTLGLGKGKFNFYKYSPQKECFVGFDQAFVKTDLSEAELFKELKASATENGYKLTNFFVGLFLQYKVVKELQRRSRVTPPQIIASPHYRVSLDTKKNINTGVSQHELLYNLKKNKGALVYYACPMIFEHSELYCRKVDLKNLRLADVSTCPSIYSDNDSHFVYYSDVSSSPIWCSEPVEGKAISPKEMVQKIGQDITREEFRESQFELLDELQTSYVLEESSDTSSNVKIKMLDLVQDSLIIIQYSEK